MKSYKLLLSVGVLLLVGSVGAEQNKKSSKKTPQAQAARSLPQSSYPVKNSDKGVYGDVIPLKRFIDSSHSMISNLSYAKHVISNDWLNQALKIQLKGKPLAAGSANFFAEELADLLIVVMGKILAKKGVSLEQRTIIFNDVRKQIADFIYKQSGQSSLLPMKKAVLPQAPGNIQQVVTIQPALRDIASEPEIEISDPSNQQERQNRLTEWTSEALTDLP
jgi:hypothetical protein